jgi:hypothetical protein
MPETPIATAPRLPSTEEWERGSSLLGEAYDAVHALLRPINGG